jgi:hypothetical protein
MKKWSMVRSAEGRLLPKGRKNGQWLMVLTFLLLLTSCDYKELCYDHRHYIDLKVIFDWQKSPDADVAGMTVLYYSQANTSADPVRYDYTGMNGGTAQLTQDTYRAATYNYDTEAILYRNMQSASTLEAYTRRSTIEEGTRLATYTRGYPMPKARGAEDELNSNKISTKSLAMSETYRIFAHDNCFTLNLTLMDSISEISDITGLSAEEIEAL